MKENCFKENIEENKRGGVSFLSKSAFTLIEMLVVVVIMGILASIAIPQYMGAIDKSRFVGIMTQVEQLAEAEESYYLHYRTYTANINELDIKFSLDRGQAHNGGEQINSFSDGYKVPNGWLDIARAADDGWRHERYVQGYLATPGVGFIHFLSKREDALANTRWCTVGRDNARSRRLCQNLGGVLTANSYNTSGDKWYRLP